MRAATADDDKEAPRAHIESAGRKPRILLVLPIVPWPIRRNGISLRFAPVIDYLARRYELDVLVLAEEDEPHQSSYPFEHCNSLVVMKVPISLLPRWLRRLKGIWCALSLWGPPLSSSRYAGGKLEHALLSYLDQRNYSAVIWAARHLEIACRVRRRCSRTRFVMDVVDSPTLLSFRDASTNPIVRILTRYGGWKWWRLERKVREVFDAVIYISKADAHAVSPGHTKPVHVVPNGIFHADAPALAGASPANRTIGFLGEMSYQPNVSAALRLANRIFPRIQTILADTTLLIIGRDPVAEIRRLQGPRISVTGTVDSIWPYITRANVFVFPMIEGAGLQNKILEAMYAGVPVVTTPMAAHAIGARNGEQLLIADSDAEIAEQALRVLRDSHYGSQLAERARSFVMREFSWPAILPRYEAIVVAR